MGRSAIEEVRGRRSVPRPSCRHALQLILKCLKFGPASVRARYITLVTKAVDIVELTSPFSVRTALLHKDDDLATHIRVGPLRPRCL